MVSRTGSVVSFTPASEYCFPPPTGALPWLTGSLAGSFLTVCSSTLWLELLLELEELELEELEFEEPLDDEPLLVLDDSPLPWLTDVLVTLELAGCTIASE